MLLCFESLFLKTKYLLDFKIFLSEIQDSRGIKDNKSAKIKDTKNDFCKHKTPSHPLFYLTKYLLKVPHIRKIGLKE